MLGKLLKYDLKGIFKFLIIFYVLAIFFGLLARIFFSIENSVMMNIIAQVCSGIAISMMFNILINNLMRLWVRFKQSLYGDEAYLSHTLPIEKKTLYLSKIITAIITLFTSVLVIALSFFIVYYSKENMEMIKNLMLPVATAYGSTIIKILLAFFFVFFIEFANAVQCGFTGIILGHKMNNIKTVFSVIYGIGVYMAFQLLGLLIIFIIALFNPDLMNLFFTNTVVDLEVIKIIIYLAIIIYTLTLIIGYYINLKSFEKGVNVD